MSTDEAFLTMKPSPLFRRPLLGDDDADDEMETNEGGPVLVSRHLRLKRKGVVREREVALQLEDGKLVKKQREAAAVQAKEGTRALATW